MTSGALVVWPCCRGSCPHPDARGAGIAVRARAWGRPHAGARGARWRPCGVPRRRRVSLRSRLWSSVGVRSGPGALCGDPPTNALVVCVDEKSEIQALDRTQPELPMQAGAPAAW